MNRKRYSKDRSNNKPISTGGVMRCSLVKKNLMRFLLSIDFQRTSPPNTAPIQELPMFFYELRLTFDQNTFHIIHKNSVPILLHFL